MLTDERVRQALTVVPADHRQHNCWKFRNEGHTTFTCLFFQPKQGLYLAYRNYLYQFRVEPDIAKYLEERLAWRIHTLNAPPRSVDERARNFGNTSRGVGYSETSRTRVSNSSKGRLGINSRKGLVEEDKASAQPAVRECLISETLKNRFYEPTDTDHRRN